MTTRYAYDCAWAPWPAPADAKANGFEGQIRYLSHTPDKNWSPSQIAAAHSAGLWVLPVWETTADRAGQGAMAGAQDCHDAETQWAALGAPPTSAIYYAVDYDPDASTVRPYFQAVKAGSHFKVGAYCSDGVGAVLLREKLIDYFWQTESTGFHGVWPSPRAHMIQHVGYQRPKMTGDYDENIVVATELGQWRPRPTEGGFLMALTDAEQKDLYDKVKHIFNALSVMRPQGDAIKAEVDAIKEKVVGK